MAGRARGEGFPNFENRAPAEGWFAPGPMTRVDELGRRTTRDAYRRSCLRTSPLPAQRSDAREATRRARAASALGLALTLAILAELKSEFYCKPLYIRLLGAVLNVAASVGRVGDTLFTEPTSESRAEPEINVEVNFKPSGSLRC